MIRSNASGDPFFTAFSFAHHFREYTDLWDCTSIKCHQSSLCVLWAVFKRPYYGPKLQLTSGNTKKNHSNPVPPLEPGENVCSSHVPVPNAAAVLRCPHGIQCCTYGLQCCTHDAALQVSVPCCLFDCAGRPISSANDRHGCRPLTTGAGPTTITNQDAWWFCPCGGELCASLCSSLLKSHVSAMRGSDSICKAVSHVEMRLRCELRGENHV